MTLAELKRDAASGKMQMEMIERYGQSPSEKFKGLRPITKVNSVGIYFRNADGKESALDLPYSSLVEYSDDKTRLTIYAPGERELNDQERSVYNEWQEIANRPENVERDRIAALSDGWGTYYDQKRFFEKRGFEYLFTEKNGKSICCYNPLMLRDPAVKGEAILRYRVIFAV